MARLVSFGAAVLGLFLQLFFSYGAVGSLSPLAALETLVDDYLSWRYYASGQDIRQIIGPILFAVFPFVTTAGMANNLLRRDLRDAAIFALIAIANVVLAFMVGVGGLSLLGPLVLLGAATAAAYFLR